jgi:flagellar hook protein FlgE
MSNSNLADSLVKLLVFQRAFEANSKALTTSDEFLKAAINLVK